MSLNDCTVLASAFSVNLYLSFVPVYLTTFNQIRRLYDVEWGTFASLFNWDMTESGCGIFCSAFPKYFWR
jgi:hypothetical protein